jgi:Flp pilus assembly protein TadG
MSIFRDDSGTTAIEAAFVLPFYFAFIFSIIELGNIFWEYNSIQYAADEVARYCAIKTTSICSASDAGAAAYNGAANIWSSASAAANEISVSPAAACGNPSGTRITITHPISSLTGYFPTAMPSPLNTLSAQSCYPNPS